jgi:hypothetical protein
METEQRLSRALRRLEKLNDHLGRSTLTSGQYRRMCVNAVRFISTVHHLYSDLHDVYVPDTKGPLALVTHEGSSGKKAQPAKSNNKSLPKHSPVTKANPKPNPKFQKTLKAKQGPMGKTKPGEVGQGPQSKKARGPSGEEKEEKEGKENEPMDIQMEPPIGVPRLLPPLPDEKEEARLVETANQQAARRALRNQLFVTLLSRNRSGSLQSWLAPREVWTMASLNRSIRDALAVQARPLDLFARIERPLVAAVHVLYDMLMANLADEPLEEWDRKPIVGLGVATNSHTFLHSRSVQWVTEDFARPGLLQVQWAVIKRLGPEDVYVIQDHPSQHESKLYIVFPKPKRTRDMLARLLGICFGNVSVEATTAHKMSAAAWKLAERNLHDVLHDVLHTERVQNPGSLRISEVMSLFSAYTTLGPWAGRCQIPYFPAGLFQGFLLARRIFEYVEPNLTSQLQACNHRLRREPEFWTQTVNRLVHDRLEETEGKADPKVADALLANMRATLEASHGPWVERVVQPPHYDPEFVWIWATVWFSGLFLVIHPDDPTLCLMEWLLMVWRVRDFRLANPHTHSDHHIKVLRALQQPLTGQLLVHWAKRQAKEQKTRDPLEVAKQGILSIHRFCCIWSADETDPMGRAIDFFLYDMTQHTNLSTDRDRETMYNRYRMWGFYNALDAFNYFDEARKELATEMMVRPWAIEAMGKYMTGPDGPLPATWWLRPISLSSEWIVASLNVWSERRIENAGNDHPPLWNVYVMDGLKEQAGWSLAQIASWTGYTDLYVHLRLDIVNKGGLQAYTNGLLDQPPRVIHSHAQVSKWAFWEIVTAKGVAQAYKDFFDWRGAAVDAKRPPSEQDTQRPPSEQDAKRPGLPNPEMERAALHANMLLWSPTVWKWYRMGMEPVAANAYATIRGLAQNETPLYDDEHLQRLFSTDKEWIHILDALHGTNEPSAKERDGLVKVHQEWAVLEREYAQCFRYPVQDRKFWITVFAHRKDMATFWLFFPYALRSVDKDAWPSRADYHSILLNPYVDEKAIWYTLHHGEHGFVYYLYRGLALVTMQYMTSVMDRKSRNYARMQELSGPLETMCRHMGWMQLVDGLEMSLGENEDEWEDIPSLWFTVRLWWDVLYKLYLYVLRDHPGLWNQALTDILYYVGPRRGEIRHHEEGPFQVVANLTESDPDHPVGVHRTKPNFLDEMARLARDNEDANAYLMYFGQYQIPLDARAPKPQRVSSWTEEDVRILGWLQPTGSASVALPTGPFTASTTPGLPDASSSLAPSSSTALPVVSGSSVAPTTSGLPAVSSSSLAPSSSTVSTSASAPSLTESSASSLHYTDYQLNMSRQRHRYLLDAYDWWHPPPDPPEPPERPPIPDEASSSDEDS